MNTKRTDEDIKLYYRVIAAKQHGLGIKIDNTDQLTPMKPET